ncbi:hypothetical protein [Pedobacter sp. ok626]|nr:hypothetical protein [Pedobacter sp. ok626]
MNSYKQLNRASNEQFARQLRTASAMFIRFLSIQSSLGDSFLKSSKDFVK